MQLVGCQGYDDASVTVATGPAPSPTTVSVWSLGALEFSGFAV